MRFYLVLLLLFNFAFTPCYSLEVGDGVKYRYKRLIGSKIVKRIIEYEVLKYEKDLQLFLIQKLEKTLLGRTVDKKYGWFAERDFINLSYSDIVSIERGCGHLGKLVPVIMGESNITLPKHINGCEIRFLTEFSWNEPRMFEAFMFEGFDWDVEAREHESTRVLYKVPIFDVYQIKSRRLQLVMTAILN